MKYSKQKDKRLSFFAVYGYTLGDMLRAKPPYFIAKSAVMILEALSMGFSVVFLQYFFESVEQTLQFGGDTRMVFIMLLALAATMAGSQILAGLVNYMRNQLAAHVSRYTGVRLCRKSAAIDPILYEDPKHLDEMSKANEGMHYSNWVTDRFSGMLFYFVPYFIFISIYFYSLEPVFVLALALAFIPTLIAQLFRMRLNAKLNDELAPIRREYWSYEGFAAAREFFKETRILGIFPHFKKSYIDMVKIINRKTWKTGFKNNAIELGTGILTLFGYLGVIYMLFQALLDGRISVGAFAAVFSALGMLFSRMNWLVRWHWGVLMYYRGVIGCYVKFMKLPDRPGKNIDAKGDIVVKNCSFRYPNSEHLALNNLSITIREGETAAIVGENGAGKSTLVKLLMGIYRPTEGSVYFGGVDTRDISFHGMSAVFQNYQKYMMTLYDNISISDSEADDPSKVMSSARESDLPLDDRGTLPQGLDTMLSREFDGTDLSGGQWQRVALARGLYRRHDMIVLDEPTAAIDPLEETRIYRKFAALAKGKTAVVVTHRLGSARIADRIIVMKDGRIAEEGNHDELMQCNGLYAEMFNAQAQWYTQE
jgi:ATP-binding cassette subfamily B protein